MARMSGLEANLARLKRLPQAVKTDVGSQLAKEVEGLTEAIQQNTPVNELDTAPGQLRESVHFYPNPSRPLSYRITADAKDDKGNFIGPHVEHGHKARDGSHVARIPFFFSTYRSLRKGMRRRVKSAGTKQIRSLFPRG